MQHGDSQRSLRGYASDEELENERMDLLDQGNMSQGENEEPQHPIPAPLDEASTHVFQ